MYYTYLLRKGDGKIYIGYTNDLRRRFKEHKDKNPELIYYEAYKDEADARDRERKLKQRGRAVKFLKNRIKNSLKK
jgi:putative endonuclease